MNAPPVIGPHKLTARLGLSGGHAPTLGHHQRPTAPSTQALLAPDANIASFSSHNRHLRFRAVNTSSAEETYLTLLTQSYAPHQ